MVTTRSTESFPEKNTALSRHARMTGKKLSSGIAMCGFLGVVCMLWAGCGALEPMDEPEVTDLQLTVETLKASVRDAQRTASELRNELEASRQSLAAAQVARAQLEGRVREAERRVAESKQVIDLQREQLAAARTDRERFSHTSAVMQSQLKQLQKQLSKHGKSGMDGQPNGPSPASAPVRKTQKAVQANATSNSVSGRPMAATPATFMRVPVTKERSSVEEYGEQGTRQLTVKPGDTLWNIAHRYDVDVDQLQAMNQLQGNRIMVGQTLWLPDSPIGFEGSTPAP